MPDSTYPVVAAPWTDEDIFLLCAFISLQRLVRITDFLMWLDEQKQPWDLEGGA
jgi:hypothetical protein